MTDMECKTCGSTRFKKISYHLYECEYCGNEYDIADVHRVDNPKYASLNPWETILNRSMIYNPTKTCFLSPFIYNEENLQ